MAWEKIISHYEIKVFRVKDKVPHDAVFLSSKSTSFYAIGQQFDDYVFYFNVPVYKKCNVKRVK